MRAVVYACELRTGDTLTSGGISNGLTIADVTRRRGTVRLIFSDGSARWGIPDAVRFEIIRADGNRGK